jgi:integrase
MAKTSFYLDTRSGSEDFPLKLRITHRQKVVHIGLDIRLTPDQWDGEQIVNHKDEKTLNNYITTKKSLADAAIMKYGLLHDLNRLSANDIKVIVESGGEKAKRASGAKFLEYFQKKKDEKKKTSTNLSYESAINRMKLYDPLLDMKTFEEIDETYIRNMDKAWEEAGLSTNSRAVYMRNIRAVFNDAIDDEITTCYPFRKFSIKKAPTKKRNLSVEELRMLRDYPIVNDFQQKYRDIFMLCFYLRGINAVDLFGLKKSNIRLGRINYVRAKTGKAYSVKIEPEAQKLLTKYKGVDYLIDVCDGAKEEKEFEAKYKGFLQRMDKGLKKIGPYTRSGLGGKKHIKPILPFLSQYYCRHTCATLMAQLGYSNEIIACSLGHEYGNKTTNIYIEYNEKEVDEANRALIDFVNGKEKKAKAKKEK